MKILLPDSIQLDLDLPANVLPIRYACADRLPEEHSDAEFLVSWGNSEGQLRDLASRLAKLRWVQALAAGPDAVLKAGFRKEAIITGGQGLHDVTVSEHALALTLALTRRVHEMVRAQIGYRWAAELGGMRQITGVDHVISLQNAKVTIWGFGGIATALAPHLTALGAQVTGVARSAGKRAGFDVATPAQLTDLLPLTDVLIMILPESAETEQALSFELLSRLPKRALLVNVGRGSTVDEGALVQALKHRRLAGAALDVFHAEPLPRESPMWDLPNVIVSPHSGGGRPVNAAALIEANLSALLGGRPLKNQLSRP